MGSAEVEAFLTVLANERHVSPSTHRQALNALLFLYRDVVCLDLPWLEKIGRLPERKRIPVVLTVAEVQMVLGLMQGVEGLMARLRYGTSKASKHHNLTGIPRSRISSLACCTVYSP